ncbi:MAG: helix-turn-helix domain-containing protein [Wenzhouxiangellaceae bacterium]|nr:helix-turn-helix domain-containing protein [Wenzhouxiangellaceae bacterium]
MLQSFLTVSECARLLRVNEADVTREIRAGRLRALNVSARVRIPRSALRDFQARQGVRPVLPPRFRRAVPLPVVAVLVAAGLLGASSGEFPFPQWQQVEIPPQTALFRDEAVGEVPDTWLPVNAPLEFMRFNQAPNPDGTAFTHMLMSLQQRNDVPPGSTSFPWTLFVNLDTNHDNGDGVAASIRADNRGSGWLAAEHVDVLAWGDGPTIGSNIETLDVGGRNPFLVGMNVQNKAFRGNVGMQIQTGPLPAGHPLWQPGMDGGWETGFRLEGEAGAGFYGTGIELGPRTHGRRGIWIRGNYGIGIDLGANNLSMRGGSRVVLSRQDRISMRFNREVSRIEFLRGNDVIGFLDANLRDVDLAY